MEVLTMIKK